MARFCPLFSGSSGNCTYIGTPDSGILVDVGVSAKRIECALNERGIEPSSIQAIFITHEHTDHISGLRVLTKRYGYKVYASAGTLDAMLDSNVIVESCRHQVMPENGVEAAGMFITGFHTSHDSRESMGFRIRTADERSLAVATDTGCITEDIRKNLLGCDLVLLESNHDLQMLKNGPYPYYLKKRILANTGHLSNTCCAEELPELANSGVTRFVLGHLSQENNKPDIAYQESLLSLLKAGFTERKDFLLSVAPRTATSPVMIL